MSTTNFHPSNAPLVLLEHASRCGQLTNGVFQAPLFRIESENFSHCCDFLKLGHSLATSARCVLARNYIGHKMRKRDVPIVVIGMKLPQRRIQLLTICSGFSHVSIFNQEILNPSKLLPSDLGIYWPITVTERNSPELRRDALDKLRLITDRIMLRRVKRDHTASMEVPPKR